MDWIVALTKNFTEEFNKYLSYVRNLGFEDTPDYDYMRDLFTQALKSTGDVEDGEYDWMKLNNGKGWEAMKAHPSAAHLHHNNVANTSARDLHGHRASKTPIPPGRLEAELPKPGATRPPNAAVAAQRQQSGRRDQYGQDFAKRRSNGQDLAPPEGSTAAQFANSSGNLPNAARTPQQTSRQNTGTAAQAQRPTPSQQPEQKPSGMQKFLKVLCCG